MGSVWGPRRPPFDGVAGGYTAELEVIAGNVSNTIPISGAGIVGGPVPTLPEWGFVLLILSLITAGFVAFQKVGYRP